MASITSQGKVQDGLQPIASELYPTSKGQVSNQGMHIPDIDMVDGKNIMPTLNGYTSFFGKNQQIGADAIPTEVQDILSYRTFSGNTILIALVRDGLYVKTLAGDGVATVTETATEINVELFQNEYMSWTRILTTVPVSSWEIWTHCIIRNKLYLYQKGLGFLLRVDSIIYGEFEFKKLNPTYVIGTGQKNSITITGEEEIGAGTYKEFEFLVNAISWGKFRIDISTSTGAYSAPEQWEEKLSIPNIFSVHANISTRTKNNWQNFFSAYTMITNTGGRTPTIKRTLELEGFVDGATSELNIDSYSPGSYPDPWDSPNAKQFRIIDFTIDLTAFNSADFEIERMSPGPPFWSAICGFSWTAGATLDQKIDAILDGFKTDFNAPLTQDYILDMINPDPNGSVRIIFFVEESDGNTPYDHAYRVIDNTSGDFASITEWDVYTPGTDISMANSVEFFDHDYMSYLGPYNVHFTSDSNEILPLGTPITFSMAGYDIEETLSDGVTPAIQLMREAAIALAQKSTNDLELLYDDGSWTIINFDNPNFDPVDVQASHHYLANGINEYRSFGIRSRIRGGVVAGSLPDAAWDYTNEPINFYEFLQFQANGFNTGDATFAQFVGFDVTDPSNRKAVVTDHVALRPFVDEMDVSINSIWNDPNFTPDIFNLFVDCHYTITLGIALFDSGDTPSTASADDATSLFTISAITTVPEPLPQVEGIFSARDRLGAWTDTNKIHWSSAVDVTDFQPSKTTQANELSVNAVRGHTVFCMGYDNGFVMYNTGNLVVGGYKGGQFVFDFKAVEQSSGCIDPRHVTGNLSAHYYWSELGLQVVQPAKMEASVIDPSLTDWLNKYRFPITLRLVSNRFLVIELQYSPDTFDYRQAREETTPNALQEGQVARPFVGAAQLQIPTVLFGRNLYPTYKRALVFDILLSKWGTCDQDHKVLYSLNPINQQGFPIEKDYYLRDAALHNELRGLAILDDSGNSWLSDTKNTDAYCLFGKYAVHRYRETKLVEIFAEFVNVPTNTQAQIERTIAEQEIYDITSDTRIDGIQNRLDQNLAGNWFNILIRGEEFHLKRLMTRGYAYGR